MSDLPQFIADAIRIGSLYALIALGYTMVYGVLKFINFAHSDIFVLGSWTSVFAVGYVLPNLGIVPTAAPWWSVLLVMLLAIAVCSSAGFLIERLAYKPIRKAPRLNALITAIGVSLLLQNVGQLQFELNNPSPKIVAAGVVTQRVDARTIRLDQPIEIDVAGQFVLMLKDAAGEVRESPLLLSPGTIPAGQDVRLDRGIPAKFANASFELSRRGMSLMLPFGAKPSRVPEGFISTEPIFERTFESQITNPDGSTSTIQKPFRITAIDVTIVGTTLATLAGLQFLVFGTRLGTAMRAVSFNMDTAALMGIPVNRIVSITFVIGTSLAAIAGFLYAINYPVMQQPAHQAWIILGLKAFIAAVVGGIGNIRGAAIGGFLIAALEKSVEYAGLVTRQDWVSGIVDVVVFALLIVVLLVKPSGLFGSTVREKV
jgi:branched-subunit amino acid ABC-type transport system permease component